MEGVAGMERAGVLEAICRYRRRLELVTCMYCPAHRGVGPSAYADAVAKEYLSSGRDEEGRERLREEYIYKREGKGVMYEVREEAEGSRQHPLQLSTR